ncbi:helicase protein [Onchocerca flexuosa]|uniref:DNA repair and recombination protein RAD54-like n=1 Tax=Onchocerca flexuosa TaxID=387005 RepID=A0A238BN02_9BILA|nr:helicase protein [Onchocerca flexuosa]
MMRWSRCANIDSTSQSNLPDDNDETMTSEEEGMYYCYEVLYGKISSRMHKRWQGDGFLFCRKRSVILQTESGEEVAKASGYSVKQLNELKKGSRLKVNNYELEVQAERTSRQPVVDGDENTDKQQVVAELVKNVATNNENPKKLKGITYQNFISPFFGRDDPLDFVLDEPTRFNELLAEVMLRRTAEVIHEWLPPKNDYIIWCRPSPLQCFIYKRLKKFLSYDHLTLIDVLRKLCNHPSILYQSIVTKLQTCKMEEKEFYNALLQLFPNTYNDSFLSITDSGKLSVFGELMGTFREQEEKVVVVSNFTKTLDLLEELCQTLYYTVLRLDGSTEAKKRMEIVEEFNLVSNKNCAFLLSAKAGGLGLNLIGASRMILFDSDWNPAVDMQAMARIWRQGQKRPCYIYRLITGGTVDEKILQRQIKKSSLSVIVEMVPVESLTHFSDEELQDIFTLRDETECETHCLLECQCNGCGLLPEELEADREINPNTNAPSKLNVENVTSVKMDENEDRTSIPEDSVQSSSADPLIQNYSGFICPNNNEVLEDEAENKILGDEAALSAVCQLSKLINQF